MFYNIGAWTLSRSADFIPETSDEFRRKSRIRRSHLTVDGSTPSMSKTQPAEEVVTSSDSFNRVLINFMLKFNLEIFATKLLKLLFPLHSFNFSFFSLFVTTI